jgi:hypothetical protein
MRSRLSANNRADIKKCFGKPTTADDAIVEIANGLLSALQLGYASHASAGALASILSPMVCKTTALHF